MKNVISVCVLGLAVAGIALSGFAGEKRDKKRNPTMQKKLEHSQKVLEGLAVGDFDLIAQNADDLTMLSKKAEWSMLATPEYTLHSNGFRRNVGDLVRTAKDKNLDGATLAYVQLTMTCVECHKYVRDVRRADLRTEYPGAPRLAASRPRNPTGGANGLGK